MKTTSTPTLAPSFSPSAKDQHIDALPKGSRVVVFGAGAFGGWAALMLLEHGYKVTLIDPWGPGNSRSSSGGESRLIRMVYGDNMLYTMLAARSYTLWEQYEQLFGIRCLVPTGNLWFCQYDDATILSAIDLLKRMSLLYEVLTPKAASARWPHINPIGMEFVLHEQKTGFLYARQATMAVVDYFTKKGGTYLALDADFSTLLEGGQHVRLANGSQILADRFIFACGPWLPTIFPEWLGASLEVTRQEIYYFGVEGKDAAELYALPTWIDNTVAEHYYGVPNTAYRGFKLAADVRGPKFDPTYGDRVPTTEGIAKARQFLSMRFPAIQNAPLLEARVCQYTNAPGGNFIFDRHPTIPHIYALGGGSGHGFKHGPAVGELVAKATTGERGVPEVWGVH